MATKNPTLKRNNGSDWDILYPITLGQNVYGSGTQATTPLLDSSNKINGAFLPLGSTSSTAASGNHLYHYWTSNQYYSDSYSGGKNWRMMTENVLADTLRFKAGTIDNKEYYNYDNSTWTAWNKDFSNLFDGMYGTNTAIPYAQRKFRFTITSSSGWPTDTMVCLEGSWYDAGTVNKITGTNYYVIVTIETRSTTNDSWTTKVTANFSNNCMNKQALCVPSSALHTGHTLYRITVELAPWTNTTKDAALRRLMILSNYGGNSLTPFTFNGSGKVTAMNTFNATTLQEGGTNLSSKYLLLAGGTMSSGAVIDMNGGTIKFTGLASSVSSSPKLEAYVGTTRKGFFGWNENGVAIFNAAGREYTIASSAFYKQGSGDVNLGSTGTNLQWHNLYMNGAVDWLNSSYHGQLAPTTLTAARTWTLPDKTGTIALTSDIPSVPTKTSDLTNDSGFITSSSLSNYVDKTTDQEIDGTKTFLERPQLSVTTRLPNTYQEVRYIGATGSQYIDTGFKSTSEKLKVEFGCSFPNGIAGMSLMGSNSPYNLVPYGTGNNIIGHWVGNGSGILSVEYSNAYNDVTYVLDNGSLSCTINGNTTSTTYTGSIQNNYNFYIFGKNGGGTSSERGNGYNLYYMKIYNNGTLVRNLVPCYRKSDNVIGLYDLVNSTFYTNAGSGTFNKGAEIKSSEFLVESDLSTVAVSGNYNDLTNKPTIPTSYVSSVNGSSGAITNVAKTNSANTFTASQTFAPSSTTTAVFKSNSTYGYIEFKNSSNTTLGYFGINSSKKPVFYDTSNHQLAYLSDISSGGGTQLYLHEVDYDYDDGNTWITRKFFVVSTQSTAVNSGGAMVSLFTGSPYPLAIWWYDSGDMYLVYAVRDYGELILDSYGSNDSLEMYDNVTVVDFVTQL